MAARCCRRICTIRSRESCARIKFRARGNLSLLRFCLFSFNILNLSSEAVRCIWNASCQTSRYTDRLDFTQISEGHKKTSADLAGLCLSTNACVKDSNATMLSHKVFQDSTHYDPLDICTF